MAHDKLMRLSEWHPKLFLARLTERAHLTRLHTTNTSSPPSTPDVHTAMSALLAEELGICNSYPIGRGLDALREEFRSTAGSGSSSAFFQEMVASGEGSLIYICWLLACADYVKIRSISSTE